MKGNIIVVSGGFDPLHEGHIALFKSAANCLNSDEKIIVLLNSDEWLQKKKGKNFQSFYTRKIIIENLNMVKDVLSFEDDEIGSAINGLKKIKKNYPEEDFNIYFCNGGDRKKITTPEDEYCIKNNIKSLYGIGGEDKKNSSSDILKEWNK